MSRITINLDGKTKARVKSYAKAMHLSQSQWVANVIEDKIRDEWPQSVIELAGAWKDFPTAEEIRRSEGTDIKREEF